MRDAAQPRGSGQSSGELTFEEALENLKEACAFFAKWGKRRADA